MDRRIGQIRRTGRHPKQPKSSPTGPPRTSSRHEALTNVVNLWQATELSEPQRGCKPNFPGAGDALAAPPGTFARCLGLGWRDCLKTRHAFGSVKTAIRTTISRSHAMVGHTTT